ncbi:MAG TPA: hypothetical protein VF715_19365 [Thermoleophilaceae bacterium]
MSAGSTGISIRFAGPADQEDVRRLAQLDSAHPRGGDALVAEVDGRIEAVLPLDGGRAIADPFVPSAELVTLLELRARQLDGAGAGHHGVRDLLHAMPVVGRLT